MNAPALGESAHDKAMIAKVDALEAKLGEPGAPADPPQPAPQDPPKDPAPPSQGLQQDPPKDPPQDPPKDPPQDPPKDPPKDPPPAPGKIDFTKLTVEYAEKGALSEDSLKALEAIGLTREVVESYAQGQMALQAQRDAQAIAAVGGDAAWKAMQAWAATNYTDAEKDYFDRAVGKGSVVEMNNAMLALKARYEASQGASPNLVLNQGGGTSGVGAFGSRAEITAAMRDPRYQTDEAYRSMVARRIDLTDYSAIA